jgi:hypothetical protein
MPYAVYFMSKEHKATPLTNILFLITFSVIILSASSNWMIVNTDVAGSCCQFKAEPRYLPAGTDEMKKS